MVNSSNGEKGGNLTLRILVVKTHLVLISIGIGEGDKGGFSGKTILDT